ncbi:MAG: hypothetical protein PVJ27_06005 [Candidatus Brocadiaceae bacterium]
MQKPSLWKLAPEIVTKPWGLVHRVALKFTGIPVGLGEFWLASAQTGPGNYSNTVSDPALRRDLVELLDEAAGVGESALGEVIGERAVRHLHENPHRGKTEAWYVRAAKGRTGVAGGPRTREQTKHLQHIIQMEGLKPDVDSWSEEVRGLMGLLEPLEGGEVLLVPAGTLHTMYAIGPDSALIIDELQQGYGEALLPTLSKILMVQDNLLSVQVHPGDQTVSDAAEGRVSAKQDLQANPTVRVYDFGRRPGEYPEMGFSLVDPGAGMRRVTPIQIEPGPGVSVEVMMADPHLVKSRLRFAADGGYGLQPPQGSYHVLHCLEGTAELQGGSRAMSVGRGETVFVPACLEGDLRVVAASDCVFFDDAFPAIPTLTAFLATNGAPTDAIELLLKPPRALPVEG